MGAVTARLCCGPPCCDGAELRHASGRCPPARIPYYYLAMSQISLASSEAFLRSILLDPDARACPLLADLTRRPVESHLVRVRKVENHRRFALVALLAIGTLFMLMGVLEGALPMMLIAGFLLGIIGITVAVVVLASRMEWRATWLPDEVQVYDRRWGKVREWTAPYSEFEGVRLRKLVMGKYRVGMPRTSVVYYIAELKHPDPLRTVIVASHRDAAKVEAAAAGAVVALGVARLANS